MVAITVTVAVAVAIAIAGFSVFHRLTKSAEALRFTFVRNPCARLLSTWSDRFQGRRLIAGNPSIDAYRTHRAAISRSLPDGSDQTLSFPEFVEFATATVDQRIDIHWQLQDDFATVPRLPLNLIGKVERHAFTEPMNAISINSATRAPLNRILMLKKLRLLGFCAFVVVASFQLLSSPFTAMGVSANKMYFTICTASSRNLAIFAAILRLLRSGCRLVDQPP
jgi:hypothetical protein